MHPMIVVTIVLQLVLGAAMAYPFVLVARYLSHR